MNSRVAPEQNTNNQSSNGFLGERRKSVVYSASKESHWKSRILCWVIFFMIVLVVIFEVANISLHDGIVHVRNKLSKTDHKFLLWNIDGLLQNQMFEDEIYSAILDRVDRLENKFDQIHKYAKVVTPMKNKDIDKYKNIYKNIVDFWKISNNQTSSTLQSLINIYMKQYVSIENELRQTYEICELIHMILSWLLVGFVLLVIYIFAMISVDARRQSETAAIWRGAHRSLILTLGVPAFLIDESRIIIDANLAALETFGYFCRKDELIGACIDLVLPELSNQENNLNDEEIKSSHAISNCINVPHAIHTVGCHHSGESLDLAVNRTGTHDIQGHSFETIVAQDLTPLVSKDRELDVQKKCLSQFTHEMKNKYLPAGYMLENILQAVSSTKKNDAESLFFKLQSLTEDIQNSLVQLEEADQLVSTRLQLHKMFRGNYQSTPNVQTVDILEVMQSRAHAASALGTKGVEFRARLIPEQYKDHCVSVSLDTFVFSHICNNLLSNARKHTSYGFIELSFLGEIDGKLHFASEDTGKGMPENIHMRLFKEEVASSDVRGIGLGLTSAKLFLEAIGGDIKLEWTRETTVENPLGGGTRFSFFLPGSIISVEKIDDHAYTDLSSPQRASIAKIPKSLTFHIVDDSDMIRKSIISKCTTAAKRLGHNGSWKFCQYNTVEEILPKFNEFVHDNSALVIADQNLDSKGGVLQGSDLIRALVKAQFKGCLISASGDDEIRNEHKNLGANILWSKPIPKIATMINDLANYYDLKLELSLTPLTTPNSKCQLNSPTFGTGSKRTPVLRHFNSALTQALTAMHIQPHHHKTSGGHSANNSRASSPKSHQNRRKSKITSRDTFRDSCSTVSTVVSSNSHQLPSPPKENAYHAQESILR